jgi:hypothetical protein
MALLNTHATIKKFMQHGFSEEHAEVIVDTINEQSDQLATKGDLSILRNELKADISSLKSDIVNLEIRLESRISGLESKIESVNTSLESKIDSLANSVGLLRTISFANFTILVGGILGIVLQKFF